MIVRDRWSEQKSIQIREEEKKKLTARFLIYKIYAEIECVK